MITLKIDVTKIDKEKLFPGKNGAKYLDLVLFDSQNDKYGNDYMVVQSVSKEERAAGKRGAILGNGKNVGQQTQQSSARSQAPRAQENLDEDSIPF